MGQRTQIIVIKENNKGEVRKNGVASPMGFWPYYVSCFNVIVYR